MKLLIVFYLKLGQPQSTKKTTLMERKSRRTFFFQYIFFFNEFDETMRCNGARCHETVNPMSWNDFNKSLGLNNFGLV